MLSLYESTRTFFKVSRPCKDILTPLPTVGIYVSVRALAEALKNVMDGRAEDAKLRACQFKAFAESISETQPSLEQLKAEFEAQSDILSKHADAINNAQTKVIRGLDQMDVVLARMGIKMPEDFTG